MGGMDNSPNGAETLADTPAITLYDIEARLAELADLMGIERRPAFDLERRLLECALAGVRAMQQDVRRTAIR